ncbi:AMP-binding protein [Sphingomonas sp. PR090111-T3T-6A]|uniref:AMP-binding protein n=1 Tax=Sphingomonas sp. PR090111-T3T-6A TaxID=685778 RepID=UPI000A052112|nr:AMP-binding protein [Sphingomonas sp. PR090111-T3T-6A]
MMTAGDRLGGSVCHSADGFVDLRPLSLPDMLERATAAAPDAPLIDFFGRVFTYREMAALAGRVATGLAELGIRPGDRVGLYLPNVPYYVAAYHGALRLGAVVVNLSSGSSMEELRRQIGDSGVRVVFTLAATGFLPKAMGLLADSALEWLVVGSLSGCLTSGKAFFQRFFGRGLLPMPPSDGRVSSFDELVANSGSVPRIGVDPMRDVALIQYSSGEGAARGAEFTHQALSANARQMGLLCPWRGTQRPESDERMICALPLSTIFGQGCVLNRIVVKGGQMVMLSFFRPTETIAAIRRTRANCLPATPAMLRALLGHPGLTRMDLASLDLCIVVGAPLPQALRERFEHFSDAQVVETYGLTEAGIVSCNPVDARGRPSPIDRALPATQVALAHRDDPERAPSPGEPGEIIIRGPQLMLSYRRGGTPFVEQEGRRWLRTGDIGSIDAAGRIHFVDHVADTISVTGFRVYPSQIEAILCRHPAVEQALVAGMPDHYAGELPKAFVTLAEGASATPDELRGWLNARVGKHEQLIDVEIRDILPRDRRGRLDRRAVIRRENALPTGSA